MAGHSARYLGGAVIASGLYPLTGQAQSAEDFLFVQLSDTHWGSRGRPIRMPR
jgi:hypothetical protein